MMREGKRKPLLSVFMREGEARLPVFSRPLVSSKSWDHACGSWRGRSSYGRTIGHIVGVGTPD